MNKQQVEMGKFFKGVQKFIRKMDNEADSIITEVTNHVAPYGYDKVGVGVHVFHGGNIVYGAPYNTEATLAQLKQLLREAYAEYKEKQNSAV